MTIAAPTAIKAWVRIPAILALLFHSNPMIPPHKAAMSIRKHQSSLSNDYPSFTKNQLLSILLA